MTSSLSLLIGLRFSRVYRRGSMVSLISLISTIGIILGVAVLIISLSAMNGFERELKNRILAVIPHGEIESINQPWNNWNDAFTKIKTKAPGITGATPYINFSGLMEGGQNLILVQIKGVNPQQESYFSTLSRFVKDNSWADFRAGEKQIIIGKGVSRLLKIKQGDWVSVMIPNIRAEQKLQQPKRIRLHVIGILQLNGQFDRSFAMVPLGDAQEYLDIGDSITGVAVKVSDVFDAKKIVYFAGKMINRYVYIKSWIETYGYMYRDIQMIRSIIHLTMVLVICVAGFNIVSTLVMVVKEKSAEIAVLRTLGATDSLIHGIFIWHGLLVGLFGALFGVMIGVMISMQLSSIIRKIENLIGYQFLSDSVYFIDFLPSELHLQDIIYVLAMTLFLSFLASWYPARRASHIDPVRILSSR